jgi:hypothetical protein
MPVEPSKSTVFPGHKAKGTAVIFAINYDLKKPGRDYDGLHTAIKSLGDWWHYLGSTWLVDCALDANAIFERLRPHLDGSDRVLVIRVARDYQGWLEPDAWEWINQRTYAAA